MINGENSAASYILIYNRSTFFIENSKEHHLFQILISICHLIYCYLDFISVVIHLWTFLFLTVIFKIYFKEIYV